jgi:outer membrane protein assembly factor BamA
MDTDEGEPLDPKRLRADIQALLDRYEQMGRPLAEVRVTETALDTAATSQLRLTLTIDEGPKLWLQRITVPDDARTSPDLIARLADLRVGSPLTNYDPETLQATLQESPLFASVEAPELAVTADGGAILHVPVEEAAPGAFDVVLGYLPPSGAREGGQLVGSGHLLLENLFGGGRRVDLTLDRRPGQTSIFHLSGSDPYLFGLPIRVTGQFRGEQRDSTYGERTYGLQAGYELYQGVELTGRVSREVVKPGPAGAEIRGRRQRIPRSRTLFYGLGVRYESLDRRVNPRRGLRLDVHVDQGQKRRSLRRLTAAADTIRERRSLRQERLEGTVRAFLPLFERQVLVVGGDGAVLRSRSYDRSDLFRFGGAASLRGYDEDRFLGNVTVRGLVEYRLQLDRRSYLYAFGDLGYVERPALGTSAATQDWHPGYGLGLQLDTGIGLIRTTYALNPDVTTPADGRIHFGLSVGL